jgi:hypothetical protein
LLGLMNELLGTLEDSRGDRDAHRSSCLCCSTLDAVGSSEKAICTRWQKHEVLKEGGRGVLYRTHIVYRGEFWLCRHVSAGSAGRLIAPQANSG